MKILLINQFFHPDSAATSQYLTVLAASLSECHSVTVICGSSDYVSANESDAPRLVSVIRIPNRQFSRDPVGRTMSYVTFLVGAMIAAIRIESPDVVITLTTPPFVSIIGSLLKLLRHCRHVIWEMDVYPDIVAVAGLPRLVSWLVQCTRIIARRIYGYADGIIVLGECMKGRLIRNGVSSNKLHVASNWADGAVIRPRTFPADRPLTILYSGNFGLAHDISTVQTAIAILKDDPTFRFVFAGGGRLRDKLQVFCEQNVIESVDFQGYCSQDELTAQLARGHIGLVTMAPAAIGAVVPSKVYGIMAAGRPVLFIGPPDAEPARIVREFECGWQIQPGDASALVDLLQRLSVNHSEVLDRGRRARSAFEHHYERAISVARIQRLISAYGE